jgi:hypothetical protein
MAASCWVGMQITVCACDRCLGTCGQCGYNTSASKFTCFGSTTGNYFVAFLASFLAYLFRCGLIGILLLVSFFLKRGCFNGEKRLDLRIKALGVLVGSKAMKPIKTELIPL